ncbi:hypothetical protein BH23ACT12_BH23ACT12_11430 [soil metagenome]
MNDKPDWRAEMEKAKQELGSPGILAAYWGGTVVVLLGGSLLLGGVPGPLGLIINIVIIMLAAVPIALGAGWLKARKSS